MTPQGSLFSTVFQSSRAGEDSSLVNCLGRRKARATMKTAGVALEILDLVGGSRWVRPLNTSRSAQPAVRVEISVRAGSSKWDLSYRP